MSESTEWPLWEVFIRSKQGLNHKHVGNLRAADAEMAVENARDVYTRRKEGVSIWVVESKHISASSQTIPVPYLNPQTTKFTDIRPSTIYRMKSDTCNHGKTRSVNRILPQAW